MKEDLLQFIWKMRLFAQFELTTTEGESIDILHPGTLNRDAGPDFSNGRIQIGDTQWAGNIELHVKTSQWFEHRHQNDPAYKNVILHVVYQHDMESFNIPVLELNEHISDKLLNSYRKMMETGSWIPCAESFRKNNPMQLSSWIERMTIERLEEKAFRLKNRLLNNQGNWEETTWQLLARSLGNPVNADPMEQLALQTPIHLLQRCRGQPIQIEALLLGQGGFLRGPFHEPYPNQLRTEYNHLQKKFSLFPMEPASWKFGRMRPSHFPTIRISQLADLMSRETGLFNHFLSGGIKQHMDYLRAEASTYWREHNHFKNPSAKHSTILGKDIRHSILINTIAPLLMLYGKETDQEKYIDAAVEILEKLPKEQNTVSRHWKEMGVFMSNAADSQGYLHLFQQYCQQKRCLDCHIGYQVLGKVKYI